MKNMTREWGPSLSVLAALVLGVPVASAAVNTWEGDVSSDFNDPANWSLNALATADVSTFGGLATVQPRVSADITVARINFLPGSTNYVLSSAVGSSLTLTTSPVISSQQNGGTNTVSANLLLSGGGARSIQQAGGGTLWVAGSISESTPGTQVKYERVSSANGKYLITGQSTYSGDTSFLDGTFTITSFGMEGQPGSVGRGATIWLGNPTTPSSRAASLVYAGSGETTDKTIAVGSGSGSRTISTLGATGPLVLSNLVVQGTAALPLLSFSGDTAGNVLHAPVPDPSTTTTTTITKSGTGSWRFTAPNSYTGPTVVNGGTLLIDGDQSAATGSVTVASNAALGGRGTIGGATTIATGGKLLTAQETGSPVFAANLTLNGGSTVTFDAVAAINVSGKLTLVNNWTLKLGSGFRDGGSTVLFRYGTLGATPDLAPTFDISGLGFTPTQTLSLTDTGSEIVLNGLRLPSADMTLILIR